jgi:Chalcone isomerase-like
MNPLCRWTCAAALCGAASVGASAAAATDLDGVKLEESAEVAGRVLKLNGAGLSLRMIFKVYAISLYLAEPEKTVDAVLNCDGPRCIAILMLRDVSGADFSQALADSPAATQESGLLQIGMRIAAQPRGLRKGDKLTLDWVPGVGTVIELNQRPLTQPIADRSFYNALLNVWLGVKPTDPSLKPKLLGASPA